jgi:putative DNA primase/helicase
VYTNLEHNGDVSAAYEDVKRQLGMWDEPVEVDTSGQEATASEATEEGTEEGTDRDDILLEWPVHDHGNASVVTALHPDAFAFCDALGWMANVGTHYETENAERLVNRSITETLIRRRIAAVKAEREDVVKGTSPSSARKNSVKDMYKDLVVTSLGEFDKDPDVLNCANGVVDLRTGELVAHGPSNKFTYCVPVPFVPGTESELWLTFLPESVGDYDQIAEWLCMAYGYSITGQTTEECMFYAEGPTRSGKGTFALSQLELLGYPLATSVDFSTFTAKRDGNSQNFDLADLRAARLIVAAESGRYSSLNEAVVKNITGNDQIRCAHKHREFFTYDPTFKIWLSSNYPIKGDVDDDAFWGRVRVIRFPNSHLGSEDKALKRRMASPENLLGILAWAVEGAKRWYASPQGLVTPKAVTVATQKARDELDHVQQWLDECTEPRIGNEVTNALLYMSYQNWCEENGHTPKKANAFGRSLEAKGFESCQKKIMGRPVRARRNLAIVE